MALKIESAAVGKLVKEIVALTGESETEAIGKALLERRARLRSQSVPEDRTARLLAFLEREVWPVIPEEELGRSLTKQEREEILGFGPDGV